MKKILAIIPARSGSKGLKNKNIKKLNGKPLMAYTIEAAIKSKMFEDIIVSTDSDQYKSIAEQYGAWVPFLRSEKFSKDDSSSNDVILEVIEKLDKLGKKYDSFMLLQPTSPLRDEVDIKNAVNLFLYKKANSIVSMCECEHSPIWSKAVDIDNRLDGFLSDISNIGRQKLKKYYRLNGAIYLCDIEYFKKYSNFYKEDSFAYIMPRIRSVDIDNIEDFEYAEFLIKKR